MRNRFRLKLETLDCRLVPDAAAGPAGTIENPNNPAATTTASATPGYDENALSPGAEYEYANSTTVAAPPPVPAQPGVGPSQENEKYSLFGKFLNRNGGTPMPRDQQFGRLNPPPTPPTQLPSQPSGPGSNSTPGGHHQFIRPGDDPGQRYGSAGANPCVAVIITMPDGTIAVFHFYDDDDIWGTLSKYNWPPGSTALVFGGNDEEFSRWALHDLRKFLRNNNFTVYGIMGESVWVDKFGKYYFYKPPTTGLQPNE